MLNKKIFFSMKLELYAYRLIFTSFAINYQQQKTLESSCIAVVVDDNLAHLVERSSLVDLVDIAEADILVEGNLRVVVVDSILVVVAIGLVVDLDRKLVALDTDFEVAVEL
jgi:hypothetical protein